MGNNQSSSSSSSSSTTLPQPSNFDCEICTETLPQTKKFSNYKNNRCSHHQPFCTDCVAHYIQVKVEEDKVADIKCPDLDCKNSLDPLLCRPILSTSVFNIWCDVLLEWKLLMSQKTFYCPFRECSALILNECGGNATKSQCPVCKKLFCFKCKLPWHAGYGCNESRSIRDTNDILFGQLAEARMWVRCPVCRHCVERISGCFIVRCRCGIEFCYACGRKSRLHRCSCRQHRRTNVILCLIVATALCFSIYLMIRGSFNIYQA